MKQIFRLIALGFLAAGCATTRSRGVTGPPERVLTRAEVVHAIDSLVKRPEFRSAHWGVLVVHPESGDTIYSHNAGKLFVPASNTKIVTGATILAQLGPAFRWHTTIATNGRIENGVLTGDVVVFGRGDPTISDRLREDAMVPLRDIADSLAARGITRIVGRLVQGGNAFPDPYWGAGWQWDYLGSDYAAGVAALFFNEGVVTLKFTGGTLPGLPALVSTSPARTYPAVRSTVITRSAADVSAGSATADGGGAVGAGGRGGGGAGGDRVRVRVDSITGDVIATGSLAPLDSFTTRVVVSDPPAAYLAALHEAITARGIFVDSAPSAGISVYAADADSIFSILSPPLGEVLSGMMKPSQNQLAELFLRSIGLEVTAVGRADSGLRVVRDQLLSWGVAADGFALRDGSGLTRNNFLTPETIVQTLWAMRQHEHFEIFHAAMPIAGIDGTLERRMLNTRAAGNLRAKTGTLARASAMSGYVTSYDGEEIIFSLLCNNFTTPSSAVTGLQNQIGIMLASMNWKR